MLLAKAIAFDAYGTLCYIEAKTHPYRRLLKSYAIPPAVWRHELMTKPISFEAFGSKYDINDIDIEETKNLIQQEVDSVKLYLEVIDALQVLKMRGFKLAVISNLASPYSEPIRSFFSTTVDHIVLSYEVGAIKPDPKIFQVLCEKLETAPEQVVMVGDSKKSDIQGAHKYGMQAIHLDRTLTRREAEGKEVCISDISMVSNLVERQL